MQRVSDYIPTGSDAAIHLSALCSLTGASATSIKSAIHRERLEGKPILSGCLGYWIAETAEEKQCFIRMMQKQAESRLIIVKAVGNGFDLGS